MKAKQIFKKIIKPFTTSSSSNPSTEADVERIAAREQKHFSYDVLSRATDKFHANRKLGEGGFGPVYRGRLEDGREIAVKRLSQNSRQGKREFKNEAKLLARVQHRNVVNLLGYCAHGDEKLLVYEYVTRESLDKYLFKSDRRAELDWKKRYDIIVGVAKGLHYLHEDAHSCIIHRDIKASNILLDEKWVPKIADFGMAKLFPEDETHVQTRVAGTNGYMAPEYLKNGYLTVKADVFSFGVLMLELVTGQKNSTFNNMRNDVDNLLDWAYRKFTKGRSLEIMDQTLAPTAVEEQVNSCIHIGLLCTQSEPSLRPTMQRVQVMLSKKHSSLEQPTRPASFTGRQRWRSTRTGPSSSNAGTLGASSSSMSSTSTISTTTNTATVSANATNTSAVRSPGPKLPDPRGKRPMES